MDHRLWPCYAAKRRERKEEIAMKIIITVAALAALIAMPASAQQVKKKKTVQQASPPAASAARYSPSGNPEWDVYVRGEYVGSDPDPRVRSTIRSEATRNYNAGR
jgi:hypothetical protein